MFLVVAATILKAAAEVDGWELPLPPLTCPLAPREAPGGGHPPRWALAPLEGAGGRGELDSSAGIRLPLEAVDSKDDCESPWDPSAM
jgi:hypothetical protein